jgi:hypothetical protein
VAQVIVARLLHLLQVVKVLAARYLVHCQESSSPFDRQPPPIA